MSTTQQHLGPRPRGNVRLGEWVEVGVPDEVRAASPHLTAYQSPRKGGALLVYAGPEAHGEWHLSISWQTRNPQPGDRVPSWEEIKEARYRFCPPDLHMAMVLPPLSEYVNYHATTMHLFQVDAQGRKVL